MTLITQLRARVNGPVVIPGDPDYEDARHVYNFMIDRHPAAIVRCANRHDVQELVRQAGESGLDLAVRGGGHSVAGHGTGNGAIVADLSAMSQILIDPDRGIARAGGGATWAMLNEAAAGHGLATTGGIVSTTGIAGLTLGGGIGYLTRRFGLSCDNLLSAEVVLADGQMVTASKTEHPDLFWALRGGGGNFGVVTQFEFRLHQVGEIYGGIMLFEPADAARIFRYFREFILDAPREYGGYPAWHKAPPLPFIPENRIGDPFCFVISCWTGDHTEGARVIRNFEDVAKPAAELVGPMPYPAINALFDELIPRGMQSYWKTVFVDDLTDEAVAAHVEHGSRVPEITCGMHLYPINGASHDIPLDATAFGHRDASYACNIAGIWPDPAHNDVNMQWVRDYYAALAPHSRAGGYTNFTSADDQDRARDNYGNGYSRLVQIKRRYDPGNLFHLNQNIPPDNQHQ